MEDALQRGSVGTPSKGVKRGKTPAENGFREFHMVKMNSQHTQLMLLVAFFLLKQIK